MENRQAQATGYREMAASLPGLDSPSTDVPASTSAAISFTCRRVGGGQLYQHVVLAVCSPTSSTGRVARDETGIAKLPVARRFGVCCMPMLPVQVARPSCRTLCPAALPLPVLSLSTVSLMRHSGCSDTYMAQHGGREAAGAASAEGSVMHRAMHLQRTAQPCTPAGLTEYAGA